MKYDPRWNKDGKQAFATLRTTDTKGVINTKGFMDEAGYSEVRSFLAQEKDRWYNSDQFVGRGLEIVVL